MEQIVHFNEYITLKVLQDPRESPIVIIVNSHPFQRSFYRIDIFSHFESMIEVDESNGTVKPMEEIDIHFHIKSNVDNKIIGIPIPFRIYTYIFDGDHILDTTYHITLTFDGKNKIASLGFENSSSVDSMREDKMRKTNGTSFVVYMLLSLLFELAVLKIAGKFFLMKNLIRTNSYVGFFLWGLSTYFTIEYLKSSNESSREKGIRFALFAVSTLWLSALDLFQANNPDTILELASTLTTLVLGLVTIVQAY